MTESGRSTVEVQYLITSVPPDLAAAASLMDWARGHLGSENRLHDGRDATMGEDANHTRSGWAPQVLATLRNLALSVMRLDTVKNSHRRPAA